MDYATDLHWRNAGRARARESATSIRTRPSAALAMRAMAVEFPQVHGHPNRLPFEGVLTLVDVASDRAPSGARGHRVVLTRAAAEAALPSLLGMAIDYKSPQPAGRLGDPGSPGWDGHDARQKCGIITRAESLGITLSEAIAPDVFLPPTALAAPAQCLANLTSLAVTSATATALTIDAGCAPPTGGGFEVRLRDWDFAPTPGADLVLRSPTRTFTIPRAAQTERYFIRAYDNSTPPLYARLSAAIFTNLPIA